MAQKKDGLCASTITDCHTVHAQPPAMYHGGVTSCAKSTAIFNIFFYIISYNNTSLTGYFK